MKNEERLHERINDDVFPTFKFRCWNDFFAYINGHMGKYDCHYIWRGQADSTWEIVSSLKRHATNSWKHLLNFRKAISGLTNYSFYALDGDEDAQEKEKLKLWELGQHFGLATPLIDWTEFPFVAVFFAFHEEEKQNTPQEYRAVYALDIDRIRGKNYEIINNGDMGMTNFSKQIENPPYSSEFIERLIERFDGNFIEQDKSYLRKTKSLSKETIKTLKRWQHHSLKEKTFKFHLPNSTENYRVYNQGGLFCSTPNDISVETWVRENAISDLDKNVLQKFLIPNRDRKEILKALNKMRINYLSLFPDFEGAAKYCNMALKERDMRLSDVRAY